MTFKKETGVAIFLGVMLGVMIAGGLIFLTKQKVGQNKKTLNPDLRPTISKIADQIEPLIINEPKDGHLTDKNEIKISGKTEKGSLIVIQSPTGEVISKTTGSEFAIDFPLSLGENIIKIASYNKNQGDEKTIRVFFIAD